jgi:hypothetical protein
LKDNTVAPPSIYDVRDVKLVFNEDPHWSIGHKIEGLKSKMVTPSPAAYTHTNDMFGKNNLSCTMSGRFPTHINETPGPEKYLPKSEFGPNGLSPK